MPEKNKNNNTFDLKIPPNFLNEHPDKSNFGVIELSTKAVKFLFCKDLELFRTKGFSFDYFNRQGSKTNTGNGLNEHSEMNLDFFRRKVLPTILRVLKDANHYKIDILYCVATAAYRDAKNKVDLLEMIELESGLKVKILSEQEEARALMMAFQYSKPSFISDEIFEQSTFLTIDQGGGSTELAIFKNKEHRNNIGTASIPIGTSLLMKSFLNQKKHQLIDDALLEQDKIINKKINSFFLSADSSFLKNLEIDIVVGVGSAITSATGLKGNKQQHGSIVTLPQIEQLILSTNTDLFQKYRHIDKLKSFLENANSSLKNQRKFLEKQLTMRLGLAIYKAIMVQLNLPAVLVSGTGLWYGIFFYQLEQLDKD